MQSRSPIKVECQLVVFVIPGSIQKDFPAGSYGVNCALIIGTRKESTDKKTSLNDVLRDFQVPV